MPKRPNKSGLSHGILLSSFTTAHAGARRLFIWFAARGAGGEEEGEERGHGWGEEQKSSLTLDHGRQTVRQFFFLHLSEKGSRGQNGESAYVSS
jgi:hypothetical protein